MGDTLKTIWPYLLMLNSNLVITPQGMHPEEMGAYVLQRMSTKCFIAVLLIITPKNKELKFLSIGK